VPDDNKSLKINNYASEDPIGGSTSSGTKSIYVETQDPPNWSLNSSFLRLNWTRIGNKVTSTNSVHSFFANPDTPWGSVWYVYPSSSYSPAYESTPGIWQTTSFLEAVNWDFGLNILETRTETDLIVFVNDAGFNEADYEWVASGEWNILLDTFVVIQ